MVVDHKPASDARILYIVVLCSEEVRETRWEIYTSEQADLYNKERREGRCLLERVVNLPVNCIYLIYDLAHPLILYKCRVRERQGQGRRAV